MSTLWELGDKLILKYKEMFMKEVYVKADIKTKDSYGRALKTVNKYEEDYENGEEFFNFSDAQIRRATFKLLLGKPYSSIGHHISIYRNYLKWSIIKGFRSNKSESYIKVLEESRNFLKEEYTSNRNSKFITRDAIYSRIGEIKTRRESIVYLLIFEGVYGKEGRELLDLKIGNLDIQNKKLKIYEKDMLIPLTLIEQLSLANLETYYMGNYDSHHNYEDEGYIFKTMAKTGKQTQNRRVNTVWNIISTKAKKSLGIGINAGDLINAGMCFYLKCIDLTNGILTDKDYLKVMKKYDSVTPSLYRLWTVKNTYDAYEKYYNKNNVLFNIDSEIKSILKEIDNYSFEYPKDYKSSSIYEKELSKEEKKFIKETDKFLNNFLDTTEREQVVKIRVGQGLFRNKLFLRSCKCEICGFDFKKMLIASHCKPWCHSTDNERLDGNNGLLLCPSHDSLFDKGLISFDNDGSILLSDKLTQEQFNLLNINGNEKLYLNAEQALFIGWHRKEYFNK